MYIISFTGKSGTGKSYQATKICRKYNIDAIIDDGILIYHNRIVAGSSAKKCASKAAAMRTALFNYEEQKQDVMLKLRILKPRLLMIVGTSDRMVDWITDALGLRRANKRIYIEDFTTEEQRAVAKRSRDNRGEHVIPAPMAQIRRDFAGYFMHPARFIRNLAMYGDDGDDRTVVRPYFSYFGKFEMSEAVIGDIIRITASKFKGCIKATNYFHNRKTSGLIFVISVRVLMRADLTDRCSELQWRVKRMIEQMTAFSVNRVNIEIEDIVFSRAEWQNREKSIGEAIIGKYKKYSKKMQKGKDE